MYSMARLGSSLITQFFLFMLFLSLIFYCVCIIVSEEMGRSGGELPERVAHAYYKYGRFVSSHPISCLVLSIVSILLLSYPVARFRLPSSSPMDVYWSNRPVEQKLTDDQKPVWLQLSPVLFVQQIVVSSKVDPWNPSLIGNVQVLYCYDWLMWRTDLFKYSSIERGYTRKTSLAKLVEMFFRQSRVR